MKNPFSLLKKKEPPLPTQPLPATGPDGATLIYAPLCGKVVPVTAMKDEVFIQEILGKGIAVEPEVGYLTSPVDGKISALYSSKHALCITTESGLELLIHIGEDTVKLAGKHFTSHVQKGQQVKAGELLMEFDVKAIRKAGYTVTTPVLVVDPDNYGRIELTDADAIHNDQVLIRIYE